MKTRRSFLALCAGVASVVLSPFKWVSAVLPSWCRAERRWVEIIEIEWTADGFYRGVIEGTGCINDAPFLEYPKYGLLLDTIDGKRNNDGTVAFRARLVDILGRKREERMQPLPWPYGEFSFEQVFPAKTLAGSVISRHFEEITRATKED